MAVLCDAGGAGATGVHMTIPPNNNNISINQSISQPIIIFLLNNEIFLIDMLKNDVCFIWK